MKRIFLSLVMVFGLMLSPTAFVYAATDGCPNTWKVDSSLSGGYKELWDAKQRLGGSMVLDEGTMIFTDYSGELGPMPKPEFALLGRSDIYIYGNTKVAKKFTVQLKDCPGKTEFVLQGGSLKEVYGIVSIPAFLRTTAKDWSTNNGNRFIDFIAAQNFYSCIETLQKKLIAPPPTALVGNQKFLFPFAGISVGLVMYRGQFCGLNTGGVSNEIVANPVLLNLTPGCSWIQDNGDGPKRYGISVSPGQTCEWAFALIAGFLSPEYDGPNPNYVNQAIQNPIYVLESFKLTRPPMQLTITCVKGKLTKKVTAVNPKCPTGYKKK